MDKFQIITESVTSEEKLYVTLKKNGVLIQTFVSVPLKVVELEKAVFEHINKVQKHNEQYTVERLHWSDIVYNKPPMVLLGSFKPRRHK